MAESSTNVSTDRRVGPVHKFSGEPEIPGDKSISHRGLIFGALAEGRTEIDHLLESGDVQSTARCLSDLGVKIFKQGTKTIVEGRGPRGFRKANGLLDCGNSGTTIRLLMGVLSGVEGLKASLTGDQSLVKRPMKRVAEPLREMGAKIELANDNYAPFTVEGQKLKAINYDLKVASAQIKTAIMLAALSAEGTTRIRGEIHSRDHTERLLGHFGVKVSSTAEEVVVPGPQSFKPNSLRVPGDPSTAAFWLAGAALIPGSEIVMKEISLNPTRIGFIQVLKRMGAAIETRVTSTEPEPVGEIHARFAKLKGVTIEEAEVPSLIDELPMLAVLASQAHGVTEVRGAEELRVKETDRIEAVAENLRAMGGVIETRHDGFRIEGPQKLKGAVMRSFHDHRIAMAFSIAALVAEGESLIKGADCVGISYPEFYATLDELTK